MRDVHGVGVTLDPRDPDPAGRFKAFMEGGVAPFARRPALVPDPALP